MAAIYSTVGDLFDAAVEVVLPLKGVSGNRTLMLVWLNLLQLDIQRLLGTTGYEKLRTARTLTLVSGTSSYSLTSGDWTVDRESFWDADGKHVLYRTEEQVRRHRDSAWDDTGTVERFTQRPDVIKVWRIPNAAAVTAQSPVSYDAFARFDKFTAESATLDQYFEKDRVVLLRGLEWRGKIEDDDPGADRARLDFEAAVATMGGSDGGQGYGGLTRVGLGPYFDDDEEEDDW